MSKINISGQISGLSTYISNGVIIQSNSTLLIRENILPSSKTDQTSIFINIDNSLTASNIGPISIISDDGTTPLFNISGSQIDSIDVFGMTESSVGGTYSFVGNSNLSSIIVLTTGTVSIGPSASPNERTKPKISHGGIVQTSIMN